MPDPELHDEFVRLLKAVEDALKYAQKFSNSEPLKMGVPVPTVKFELLQEAYENLKNAEKALSDFRKRNPNF